MLVGSQSRAQAFVGAPSKQVLPDRWWRQQRGVERYEERVRVSTIFPRVVAVEARHVASNEALVRDRPFIDQLLPCPLIEARPDDVCTLFSAAQQSGRARDGTGRSQDGILHHGAGDCRADDVIGPVAFSLRVLGAQRTRDIEALQ